MNGRISLLALVCLSAAAQQSFRVPAFPPDIIAHDSPIRDLARLDTKHVQVDTENERVRVLRIRLESGESLPMHDSRDGVLVCLTACKLTLTNPVGYVKEVALPAGQTMWMQSERHRIANAGGLVELLYIESKRPQ
jgi:hypothetical protein